MLYARLSRSVCSLNKRSFSVTTIKNDFKRSTVDAQEVDHHKKFADGWWDDVNGPLIGLHSMNSARIPFIKTRLLSTGRLKEDDVETNPDYLKGIKILDVGCGGGILSIPLSRLGAEVTGIDPSTELIDVANREALARLPKHSKIRFLSTTIEEHSPQNKETYDVVVLSEVIEHITNKEEFIHICVDALKPAGSIFLTTINRTMASWLVAIIAWEYILHVAPRGTHEWDKFPTPEEIQKYLERAGCQTMSTRGIFYHPFANEWRWVSNTSTSYFIHGVKHV